MSEQDLSQYRPQPTAYGRIFRERGTRRIVIAAIVLAILWYIYDSVHTSMMNQVKWPTLKASLAGLVVIGLQDKDRPGWKHKWEARESNHAWQIRYTEEEEPSESEQNDTPGASDRGGNNPAASRRVNSGAVVPMEVLLRDSPVVLDGSHFTHADVEEKYEQFLNKHYYAVHLDLNEEGRSRYWQFSSVHDQERLAFILNGEVITCPRMANMYVGTLTIDPIWVKEDAQKLADFINSQAKK